MKDINTVSREIIRWMPDTEIGSTKFVELNTGETMVNAATHDIESEKTVTISTNGTVTVNPSENYEGMAKVVATVAVNTKFYAYSRTEGGVTLYAYTIKESPAAGDSAYIPNPDSGTDGIFQLLSYNIDSAVLANINIGGKVYSRAIAADITF